MPSEETREAVEMRAADVREGDAVWVEPMEQWMFVVGRQQGGYAELTLYMDDGPEDFLPLRFKRAELVQCRRQPTLAQELLENR
jgi:hypothetical protein